MIIFMKMTLESNILFIKKLKNKLHLKVFFILKSIIYYAGTVFKIIRRKKT